MENIRSLSLWVIMVLLGILITTSSEGSAKWWDKFGEPKYGGKIVMSTSDLSSPYFDTQSFMGSQNEFWYEPLFEPDATVDRNIWDYSSAFIPDQYWKGNLVESWEWADAQTLQVKIRRGVLFHDKPPANGRELTAYDVQNHYDRIFGKKGYEPSMQFKGFVATWESVKATGDFMVDFKFKTPCAGVALQSVADRVALNIIECPEVVDEQGGSITDWKKVIGTGPFMLKDVIVGTSMTVIANPTYWGTDPFHPENKLPYVDELTILAIPDKSTQYAALRTGKIDILSATSIDANSGVPWQQAKTLQSGNPELQYAKVLVGSAGVSFRMDKEPFTDINVRKAMQMAIDRKTIAQSYYGGTAPETPGGMVTQAFKGYAYEYGDWPQALKDEYSYNPTKAKELLAAAGYPNGFKTNMVASTANDLQLFQVLKAYFLDIGVDMEIRAMDRVAAGVFVRAGKHDQMAWIGGGFPWGPSRIIEQFYSKGPDANITMVNDAGYDAIRNNLWSSSTPEEAAKWMMEADKCVLENHWQIVGPEISNYTFWQPYLKGYSNEALTHGQVLTFARLWVDQDLKASLGR